MRITNLSNPYSIIIFLTLIILNLSLYGKEKNQTPNTKDATIHKCIQDLQSKNEKIRQQAAMILGKYQSQLSSNALLSKLKDPSHLVRRAVLVSLSERISNYRLPRTQIYSIFNLYDDQDSEVRRLATQLTSPFIGRALKIPNQPIRKAGHTQSTPIQNNSLLWRKKYYSAFHDKDDIVKINVLKSLKSYQNRYLLGDPNLSNKLPALLKSTNDTVVVLSLEALNEIDVPQIHEKTDFLKDHPSIGVLISYIKLLKNYPSISPKVLHYLSKHKNLEIKTEAYSNLLMLGDMSVYEDVKTFVVSPINPTKYRVILIEKLNRLKPNDISLIDTLLKDKNSIIRITAIKIISKKANQTERLESFLNDPSINVRKEAALSILKNKNLKEDTLLNLFENELPFIRKSVIQNLKKRRTVITEVFIEALMDDDEQIRELALRTLGILKANDAQLKELILRSIDDPNLDIKIAAIVSIKRFLSPQDQLVLFKSKLPNSSQLFKKELMDSIFRLGPIAVPCFQEIAKQGDEITSSYAKRKLLQMGDSSYLKEVMPQINNEELDIKERLSIIYSLKKHPNESYLAISKLFKNSNKSIRLAAVNFFNRNPQHYKESFFLYNLNESDQRIRSQVNNLYYKNKIFNETTLIAMVKCKHYDITRLLSRILKLKNNENHTKVIKASFSSNNEIKIIALLETMPFLKTTDYTNLVIELLTNSQSMNIKRSCLIFLLRTDHPNAKKYLDTIQHKDPHYGLLQKLKLKLQTKKHRAIK